MFFRHGERQREYIKLHDVIEREFGIAIDLEDAYLFETRLSTLLVVCRCTSCDELCEYLSKSMSRRLCEVVYETWTSTETRWFRDPSMWKALQEDYLPHLVDKAKQEGRPLRIWSCGCSTGQEPYSVTIMGKLATALLLGREEGTPLEVIGTDVSSAALKVAKDARYSRIATMRGGLTPLHYSCFEVKGNVWTLSKRLRDQVSFDRLNIVDNFDHLGPVDVIMCRYVLRNFSAQIWHVFLDKVAQILRPGGLFVLGNGEWIFEDNSRFSIIDDERGVFYRFNG